MSLAAAEQSPAFEDFGSCRPRGDEGPRDQNRHDLALGQDRDEQIRVARHAHRGRLSLLLHLGKMPPLYRFRSASTLCSASNHSRFGSV